MKTEQQIFKRMRVIIDEIYFDSTRKENGFQILVNDSDIEELRNLLWVLEESEEE